MLCTLIIRIPDRAPHIVSVTENFNEVIQEFENIALDELSRLAGQNCRKITKLSDIKTRGFYCISETRKYTIYYKEKNGWFYKGDLKKYIQYELLCHKIGGFVAPKKLKVKEVRDEEVLRINSIFHNQILTKAHPLLESEKL